MSEALKVRGQKRMCNGDGEKACAYDLDGGGYKAHDGGSWAHAGRCAGNQLGTVPGILAYPVDRAAIAGPVGISRACSCAVSPHRGGAHEREY